VGLSVTLAVIVSAAVAVIYTLIGQMISVAYTDIIELIFLTVGLVSVEILWLSWWVVRCVADQLCG